MLIPCEKDKTKYLYQTQVRVQPNSRLDKIDSHILLVGFTSKGGYFPSD